jgi:NitT/TauT family transport system permease protein
VIGSFLGGILAVVIVDSDLSKRTVYPLAMASNAIPIVAISPALILALGDGMAPKICVTAFLVFFPMLVNGLRGLQSVDTQVGELMFTFSATRWQRLRLVRLPASLPFVFSALRLSACACFVAAIVSEWVSADRGLGYLIVYESSQYNTAKVWAAVMTGTMPSIVVYFSVALAERYVLRFRR